jgi:hypothetical protein
MTTITSSLSPLRSLSPSPACGTYGASMIERGWSRSPSSPPNPMNWCSLFTTACPLSLRPEDEEQWLDSSRTPFADAKSLLKAYPDKLMDAHDVAPIVNSAKVRWTGVHPAPFRMTRYKRVRYPSCKIKWTNGAGFHEPIIYFFKPIDI